MRSQQCLPNIIVFGETGAGKSSVINMILGSNDANVGHNLVGETFRSNTYQVEINGKTYNLHDTVGLGEHSGGTVDNQKAVRNLYRLLTDLSNSGGVNQLIFVMKQGRLTDSVHKNYTLFHHGFCESKVPIVVIVTGCEDVEPTMDSWWIDNEALFTEAGMLFDGHACVCAFRGRKTKTGGYRDEVLVRESAGVVKQLIVQYCWSNGWTQPPIVWLRSVIGSIIDLFRSSKIPAIYTNLYDRLTNVFSPLEAEHIIEAILRNEESIRNVIIFGETGAGKSSVINMILGSDSANVGHNVLGETFRSTIYPVHMNGTTYNLHDTVGLGEYTGGTVDNPKAVRNLYRLVTNLSDSGGVNLLVFVMKRGRLTEAILTNYTFFHHGFCESKVPIVIVVTGCENVEPTMETWWIDNEASFTKAGMTFNGHACVCAFKGRKTDTGGHRNDDLVRESVGTAKELVVQHCMPSGWEKPPIAWLQNVIGSMTVRSSKIPVVYATLYIRLKNVVSKLEAQNIIHSILQDNDKQNSFPNVVVFGAMGAGKSSVIDMILGIDKATVGHGRLGEMLRRTVYPVEIDGKTYILHDTVGLGEYTGGTVNNPEAVKNLYRLVADLSDSGGINLLIYVIRCNERPAETLRKNYSLFHSGFCESKVPIVIVVTGCENVQPTMDTWWIDHQHSFTRAGMSFKGYACVCAFKGTTTNGAYCNEDLVEDSVEVVRQLVVQSCRPNGWKKPLSNPPQPPFTAFRKLKIPPTFRSLYDRLTTTFSHSEAEDIIKAIRRS